MQLLSSFFSMRLVSVHVVYLSLSIYHNEKIFYKNVLDAIWMWQK